MIVADATWIKRELTMYKLTLTKEERKAVDWIGGRYRHGHDLRTLLLGCVSVVEWDDDGDATYEIPEYVAWDISEIVGEGLDCFGDELRSKLYAFRDDIV